MKPFSRSKRFLRMPFLDFFNTLPAFRHSFLLRVVYCWQSCGCYLLKNCTDNRTVPHVSTLRLQGVFLNAGPQRDNRKANHEEGVEGFDSGVSFVGDGNMCHTTRESSLWGITETSPGSVPVLARFQTTFVSFGMR